MITIDKAAELLGFVSSNKCPGAMIILNCKFFERKEDIWEYWLTDYDFHGDEDFGPLEELKLKDRILIQRIGRKDGINKRVDWFYISLEMDEEIVDEFNILVSDLNNRD